ncbi:MAG: class I SAM-dependent methyltransferase [Bacillota bacterium]
MPLSPRMYHWFVRPKWFTNKYIHEHIKNHFHLDNKTVLDFGSGTGANCSIFKPGLYLGIEPDGKRVGLAKQLYPEHNFMTFKENRIPAQNDSIDYIFIIAVLHHIDDKQIKEYLLEFERILKPGGKVIVMEPYLCNQKKWNNRFMNWYDDGEYIRNENSYLDLFQSAQYECQVLKKFTKCYLYNELFFFATKKGNPLNHLTHETTANSWKGGEINDSCVPS